MQLSNENEARAYVAKRTSPSEMSRLEAFIQHLTLANETQNLVARQSLGNVWQRHIADSLQLGDHVSRETSPWVDFGAGAGLPAIPLAIVFPERLFVMIESRGLRIAWLNEIRERLSLTNAKVIGQDVRLVRAFPAAVISARAFAPLPKLMELSAPFSTRDTAWVLPKGRSARQELAQASHSVREMFHVEQSITDETAGILVGRGQVEVRA